MNVEQMVCWFARQSTTYPTTVSATVDQDEDGVTVEVQFDGGESLICCGVQEAVSVGIVFMRLTVAIALQRMKRERGEVK